MIKNNGGILGHIEASSGSFAGRIEAKEGYLDNVTIGNDAVFLGTIKSGPVFISNETTAAQPARVFNSGTAIRTIVQTLGSGTINVSTGFYGSRQGLISVISTAGQVGDYGTGVLYPIYTLKLVFNDATELTFTATNYMGGNVNATISQQLSMGGSVPGKIFIIDNLPTGSAGLPPGSVYRNGNQLMIV